MALYAPVWTFEDQISAPKIAYRVVKRQATYARWVRGVTEAERKALIPGGWFDTQADATFASDPWGEKQDPPVLRAPNGVMLDFSRFWHSGGEPTWDPTRITVPVLLVQGEWDADTPLFMSQALFPQLTAAPWKRYTLIGEGTHMLMLEKNRQQLFDVVQAILEEPAAH